jgi:hypothetical protein
VVVFVTYGWGMVLAAVRIGKTKWKTSRWPKGGLHIVPIKASVRRRRASRRATK